MSNASMLSTVTGVKHMLTPGTPVRIVNHVRPQASRVTTVHAKTNTVDLVTYAENAKGEVVPSHSRWPKAKFLRHDLSEPGTFHIDAPAKTDPHGKQVGADTIPFLTITVLDDATDVPDRFTA